MTWTSPVAVSSTDASPFACTAPVTVVALPQEV
jgi:hypothetical protein